MQQASYLEGGLLMWLLPLHVNQKSDYDMIIRSAKQERMAAEVISYRSLGEIFKLYPRQPMFSDQS